jgi:hypothetical protein
MFPFRKLPRLPADDDSSIVAFPPEWAKHKPGGLIVEFVGGDGQTWIGNFRKGATALSQVVLHPNGRDVVVIADGALWIVDPQRRTARDVWTDAREAWHIQNPDRFVVSDGRSFLCLDAGGDRWRTAPLTTLTGFDALQLDGERLDPRLLVDALLSNARRRALDAVDRNASLSAMPERLLRLEGL